MKGRPALLGQRIFLCLIGEKPIVTVKFSLYANCKLENNALKWAIQHGEKIDSVPSVVIQKLPNEDTHMAILFTLSESNFEILSALITVLFSKCSFKREELACNGKNTILLSSSNYVKKIIIHMERYWLESDVQVFLPSSP